MSKLSELSIADLVALKGELTREMNTHEKFIKDCSPMMVNPYHTTKVEGGMIWDEPGEPVAVTNPLTDKVVELAKKEKSGLFHKLNELESELMKRRREAFGDE